MAEERERKLPERWEERGITPFEAEWFMESPFRMLQRMREEIDRAFGEWPGFGRGLAMPAVMRRMMPSADVWETDNEVKLRVDLPGVEPDNVEIFTTEDSIRIRGEMKKEEEEREKGMYRAERRYGVFDRTLMLPTEIQPDKAKATFRHGVLEVTLPKTEQAKEKMRKVPIEVKEEKMAGAKKGESAERKAKEEKAKGKKK